MDEFIRGCLDDIDKCAERIALNISAIKGYCAGVEVSVLHLSQQGAIPKETNAKTRKEDKYVEN